MGDSSCRSLGERALVHLVTGDVVELTALRAHPGEHGRDGWLWMDESGEWTRYNHG